MTSLLSSGTATIVPPRLQVRAEGLPQDVFMTPDAELPEGLIAEAKGAEDDPWLGILDEVEALRRDGRLVGKGADDAALAPVVFGGLPITARTAADPAVWHYATLAHFRDLAFQRWPLGKDGMVSVDRILGSVRRNTIGRLWWMLHTLASDGFCDRSISDLALGSTERMKLRLLDDNSLHGRPWLAREMVAILHRDQVPTDGVVEQYFKALGRLSNVLHVDAYSSDPSRLLHLLEVEVARAAGEER